MAKTQRINLNITSASDDKKKFKDFRNEIAGDNDDSNMVIIDTKIGELQDDIESANDAIELVNNNILLMNNNIVSIKTVIDRSVLYSSIQPTTQEIGDIWNEEL